MTEYRLIFREDAISDIQEIYDYILDRSSDPVIAARYRDRIRAYCERIVLAPSAGRPRDDIEPGLRSWPFDQRIIVFYKIDAETVIVTNVFARGRDYDAALRT